jgi:hypothetical protein
MKENILYKKFAYSGWGKRRQMFLNQKEYIKKGEYLL